MQFISSDNSSSHKAHNITDLDNLAMDFNITFIDNRAADGNAVYAQPIYNCSWYSESVIQVPTDSVEDVYANLFHFEFKRKSVSYEDHMRSHPYRPCFCNKDPSCHSDLNTSTLVHVYPGRPFNVSVIPADRNWRPLRSIIESKLKEGSGMILFENSQQSDVFDLRANNCSNVTHILLNKNNVSTNTTIKLSTQGAAGRFIMVNVTIMECPFGFQLNGMSGICDCVSLLAKIKVQCDIRNSQFIKAEMHWIGQTRLEPNVTACATKCPDGYCYRHTTVNISNLEEQCMGNRMGEICGQCVNSMSMKFGTTDCGYCSNYWLFTIFLYMLSGIVLVIVLFLLKLTISEGPFGAVIFYAQVFSINLSILLYSSKTRFAAVFISLLNLELGFPLCFFSGMDQIGKQGLQFVYPVYLWLIVAVITIISRYSNKLSELVGSDCSKVFVTLIYLSYTKLLRTCSAIFVPATIGTDTNHTHQVWFLDGGVRYFKGLHLLLGLIALAFLILILAPYNLFILLGQWCLHNSWISRHFKPLIDATLAPFKDRWRFWFGMRLFIIDILVILSVVISPMSSHIVICMSLVVVLLLLVFQANFKPYKSDLLHNLDLFFLTNYVLFLVGYLFIHRVLPPVTDCHFCMIVVEILFVGSALLVSIMIAIRQIVARVRKFRGQIKLREFNEIEKSTSVEISDGMRQRVIAMDLNEHESVRLRESLLADD